MTTLAKASQRGQRGLIHHTAQSAHNTSACVGLTKHAEVVVHDRWHVLRRGKKVQAKDGNAGFGDPFLCATLPVEDIWMLRAVPTAVGRVQSPRRPLDYSAQLPETSLYSCIARSCWSLLL